MAIYCRRALLRAAREGEGGAVSSSLVLLMVDGRVVRGDAPPQPTFPPFCSSYHCIRLLASGSFSTVWLARAVGGARGSGGGGHVKGELYC